METFLSKLKLLLQALILAIAFGDSFQAAPKFYYAKDVLRVVPAQNRFAMRLYQALNVPGDNLLMAPMSISMTLGMAYVAAIGNTKTQMQRALNFPIDETILMGAFSDITDDYKKNKDYKLKFVNKAYIADKFELNQEYRSSLFTNFKAEAKSVFFGDEEGVQESINKEVEYATNYKIRKMVSQGMINQETEVLLLSAVYFKGAWKYPFNPAKTYKGPFWYLHDKSFQTDFMKLTQTFNFANIMQLNAKVLSMPYEGKKNRINFNVILPNRVDGLAELERRLINYDLTDLLNVTRKTLVSVKLPKFKIDNTITLPNTLRKLGITDLFDRNRADLPAISKKYLSVSNVIHKSFIEIDEEGTEAAGAAGMSMAPRYNTMASAEFIVDRPFLFFIHDTITKQIMFLGTVKDIY